MNRTKIISKVFNEDCTIGMKRYPDNHFDLAVVDPQYGLNYDIKQNSDAKKGRKGTTGSWKQYEESNWDSEIPDKLYFNELFRVSKNQIIWGGNMFFDFLPSTKCVLIWDKLQKSISSDFELAWTSFDSPPKAFRMTRLDAYVNNHETKIHPTQKPIELYEWIFRNYTNKKALILDTHLGSGSSRIAAHKLGLSFIGFENNSYYYKKEEEWFKTYLKRPIPFFTPEQTNKHK